MKIEFDPNKSEKNLRERGIAFDEAHDFDWLGARYVEDNRKKYPEQRFIAIGQLGLMNRIHVVCFTPIEGGVRVISLRKANSREVKRYEKEIVNN